MSCALARFNRCPQRTKIGSLGFVPPCAAARRYIKKLGARYDRDEHAWFFKAGTPDTEAKLQKLKAAFEATVGTPKKRQVASNATASPAKKSRPATNAGNQGKSGE